MILFVIVTAVVNIGLGYALALYLGRTRRCVGEISVEDHEIASESPAPLHMPAPAAAPIVAADPAADVTSAAEAGLEQDVLAGIEEFRNQLAQMKAQPMDDAELVAAR